jgi:uncharacterized protein YecE (DUF72 family)
VKNWKEQTPNGFVFSLKFPQLITHIKMLKDCQQETATFLDRAELLGEKLGPLLLQFPPYFGVVHMADLTDYLAALPRMNRYVVEVRNESWFNNDFYALLRASNVALAWRESALTQEHNEVTSTFLYLRWEGDRQKVKGTLGKIEADRRSDLDAWAIKLRPYIEKQTVYGYFGKYFSGYPPSDITYLQSLLLPH